MANNITKSKNKLSSIPKLLKYCAAALSVVSFLTTMHGIKNLIVDDELKAGMISFAVQGIILLLGLYFLNVWNAIENVLDTKKLAVAVLRVLILILYASSLIFSSFFSFVFITNSAYDGVGLTDYNMEIEQFLINSTNELERINDENCDKLLLTIRTQAPEFNNLLQQNKNNASNEIESIKNGTTKFDVATIKEEDKFTAAGARNVYRAANPNDSQERLDEVEESCREFESIINPYTGFYEGYYNDYSTLYESLANQIDSSNIEIEKEKIDDLILAITETKEKLMDLTIVVTDSVKSHATEKRDVIANYYTILIKELSNLKSVYNKIENNETVKNGDGSELKDFYESIYSSDIVDTETISSAESQLQSLLQIYLNYMQDNEIESNSEKIESLSICISNLNSLKKGIKLQHEISDFKSKKLNKVYIIQSSDVDSNNEKEYADIENEGFLYTTVTSDRWKAIRHEDIAQFIGLVKQIPNSDKNDRISEMLSTAYKLNRNNLESISKMENAINFLKSEQNTVAWISLIIAIFIDLTSFLIGIILFFLKSENTVISPTENTK